MNHKNSILNAVKELDAIRKIYLSLGSDDQPTFFKEAISEVIYNLELAYSGIEYKSDEYQYLSSSYKEVMGDEDDYGF